MKLSLALCTAALLATSLAAQAGEAPDYGKHLNSAKAVAKSRAGSFDVFIDGPTGFAFVHTPDGWKFTRKVENAAAVTDRPAAPSTSKQS